MKNTENIKINKTILWITQSAVLIALLVSWQAVSKSIPGTLVTGTGVNFILIIATVVCSLKTGLTVAGISPIMVMLLGIMPPFWILVPLIAIGNVALVLIWHLSSTQGPVIAARVIALFIGAGVKFAVLYLGINIIVPNVFKLQLPPPVLVAFSFPQLITASIGGLLALGAIPLLERALKGRFRA